MYACVCHAVTEEQVRACAEHVSGARAANQGLTSGARAANHELTSGARDREDRLRHVVRATRAGSGCGSCVNRLRGLCADPTPATELREPASAAA